MKYKKFNEIQLGDIIWCVEISNVDCHFNTYKVNEIAKNIGNPKLVEMHIDASPLWFSFIRNSSNWHNMIFTTKEEAISTVKKQLLKEIKNHLNIINKFSEILSNVNSNIFNKTNE